MNNAWNPILAYSSARTIARALSGKACRRGAGPGILAAMTTFTSHQRLAQVALQLQQGAVALAQAYAAQQAGLQLERVLDDARLSSLDGIAASLATVDALEALMAHHLAAWKHFIVEANRQYAAALADVSEDERAEALRQLAASLQFNLDAQQRGVAARTEWIDAARIICRLAREGRELEPDADVPVFADAAALEELQRQMARIDAAAAAERALVDERAARVQAAMKRMQPG